MSVTEASPARSAADRSRTATRLRLLEAGRALFAERGVHRVTSHAVAGAAGVAAGTFYLHFPDKQALFREIAHEALRTLRSDLDEASRASADPRDSVRDQAEALVGFAERHRDLVRILFSSDSDAKAVEADVLGELAATIAQRRQARMARQTRMEAGARAGGFNSEVVAQAVVGMWSRVIAWWIEDPARAPREEVIATLTRIQLEGTHPRTPLAPHQGTTP